MPESHLEAFHAQKAVQNSDLEEEVVKYFFGF